MSEILPSEGLRIRQRAFRDAEILRLAGELMGERGYEGWTLDDLAEKLGISRRTLYHHFPSKDAIAARTIARNIERISVELADVAAKAETSGRLAAVLRWFVELRARPRTGPIRVIKAQADLMSKIRTSPEYREADKKLHEIFSALLREAQDAGTVSARLSPQFIANLLIGFARSIDYPALSSYSKDVEAQVDGIVSLLFFGIQGKAEDNYEH